MDFTINKYNLLLCKLKECGYTFITYSEYCECQYPQRFVILRHDVDLRPQNSLIFAKNESRIGAKATYYFRAVPESWDDNVIKTIYQLEHEVGYHYESLTTCNGNVESAYLDFCKNLKKFRKIGPVKTICMHGSPRSPYDSKDIWETYDFKILGLLGEPYLSTDFSKILYLTDTGRRWDGYKVSVRDKIVNYQNEWNSKGWSFHSTDEIIKALEENRLPNQLMITTHPQRWNNMGFSWIKELFMQNTKNIVKKVIVKSKQ